MTRIEITSHAEQDLIDIYLYGIEHFGLDQAERYSEMLHARIDTIAENPSFAPIMASSETGCGGMRAFPRHLISDVPARVFGFFGYSMGAWTPAGISDQGAHDKKNPGTLAGGPTRPAQPAPGPVAVSAAQCFFLSPWRIFEWSILEWSIAVASPPNVHLLDDDVADRLVEGHLERPLARASPVPGAPRKRPACLRPAPGRIGLTLWASGMVGMSAFTLNAAPSMGWWLFLPMTSKVQWKTSFSSVDLQSTLTIGRSPADSATAGTSARRLAGIPESGRESKSDRSHDFPPPFGPSVVCRRSRRSFLGGRSVTFRACPAPSLALDAEVGAG